MSAALGNLPALSGSATGTFATSTPPISVSSAPSLPAVPMSARGPIIAGLLTLIVMIGGFVGWASFTPLNSSVMGQAVLVVESSRRDVAHLEGGTVRQIHVRDGTEVKEGDPLLTLDPVRATAALQIVRGQIDANLILLARLRAEVSESPTIEVDEDILERARLRQMGFLQDELDGVNVLLRQGFAPRTRAMALSRDLARLQGEQGEYLSTVARSHQQIGEADLQILQVERSFKEEVAKLLQDTQNTRREQQERLIANQDIVHHLEIRAPTAGIVVGSTVFTPGGVVAPGRTLMQIVPSLDSLVIEAQIAVQDIEVVYDGQVAQIRFPALPQRTLPI